MSQTVRLQGLPPLASAIHIQNFFSGLKIEYGGVDIIGGVHGTALVKFTTFLDACYALQRSGNLLMDSCIQVSLEERLQQAPPKSLHRSVEKPGYSRIALQPPDATFSDVRRFFKNLSVTRVIFLTKNKVRNGQALVKFVSRSDAHKSLIADLSDKNENGFTVTSVKRSDEKEWVKFGGKLDPSPRESWSKSISCHNSCMPRTSPRHERYAHLINVSRSAGKRHIRRFLYDLIDDSQITFVYDKNGCRTRECFVMCNIDDGYTRVLGQDKAILKGRPVRVLPVSKEQMMQLIHKLKSKPMDTSKHVKTKESASPSYSAPKARCLYLRNFAADVNKHDILNFFRGFALNENDVHLLYGDNGDGLGEALVKFSTEEEASNAEKLNCTNFQGTEVLVRCISEEQLKVFGVPGFECSAEGHVSVDNEESWDSVDKEGSLASADKEESWDSADKEGSLASADKEGSWDSMDKEESLASADKEESWASMDNEENLPCVSMEDDSPDITTDFM